MIDSQDAGPRARRRAPTLTQALGGPLSTVVDCLGMGAIVSAAWVQPEPASLTLTLTQLLVNGTVGFLLGAGLPVLAYVFAVSVRRRWLSLPPVAAAAGALAFVSWRAFEDAWDYGLPGFVNVVCASLILLVPLIDWQMTRSRAGQVGG